MDAYKQTMQQKNRISMCNCDCNGEEMNKKMYENLDKSAEKYMCENDEMEYKDRVKKPYISESYVNNYECPCVEFMPLAMAYVPWQELDTVYESDEALMRGTIFPELDLPFYGRSCNGV